MAEAAATGSDPTPAHVELRDAVKSYAGTLALAGVSLRIARGSVHALVGANGAGKSTLGKVVGGAVRLDEGEVLVDGRAVGHMRPRDARREGIALIAQELALVPHLSVMENVFLGVEPRRRGIVARSRMREQYAALVERCGFRLPPDVHVGDLRLADQQKVEILRAVNCDAAVIVMDEPTSSLTRDEVQTLHEMIRDLRRRGTTIVYVSHFLDEVLELADTVTVMRNGRIVRTAPAQEETAASLVTAMFGAAAALEPAPRTHRERGATALEVRGLRRQGVLDVSLSVQAGEIVGLAGLVGSGRSEVARAIFGADARDGGSISVDGRELRLRSPREAIAAGIAFLPESRKHDGLFMELSLASNTTLAHVRSPGVSRAGVLTTRGERTQVERLLRDLSVQPPTAKARVDSLSGGNQQKVLFAKCLFQKPRVLVLDEPTRGVDVAARAGIHRLITDLADQGVAILLISSDTEEVLALADRVLVMRRGAIAREFGADPPMSAVMEAAFGLSAEPGAAA